jgi:hypothetical protein
MAFIGLLGFASLGSFPVLLLVLGLLRGVRGIRFASSSSPPTTTALFSERCNMLHSRTGWQLPSDPDLELVSSGVDGRRS